VARTCRTTTLISIASIAVEKIVAVQGRAKNTGSQLKTACMDAGGGRRVRRMPVYKMGDEG
jgi:hypothetical protein